MSSKVVLVALLVFCRPRPGMSQPAGRLEGNLVFYPEQRPRQYLDLKSARQVSPLINLITDPSQQIGKRIEAVSQLGDDLNGNDLSALYPFLTSLPGPMENNLGGLRVIKNDLLNALEEQSIAPSGLTRLMVEMYRNPAQDLIVRDYALQHLATWAEQGAKDEPGARDEIRRELTDATSESNSLAGTALLGLHRLGQPESPSQAKALDDIALRLANSTKTDLTTRMAAIQVCAERKIVRALPAIKALAEGQTPLCLRLSAIAALGELGGIDELRLVRRLQSDLNCSIRLAATIAQKHLETTVAAGPQPFLTRIQ